MTFIAEFRDLMPHTVTIDPLASRDEYGKPSYGTAVTYEHCRVVYKHQRVSSPGGEGHDVVSSGYVILGEAASVSVDDRLMLPNGTQPLVVSWETITDESGDVYTKIYFGAV